QPVAERRVDPVREPFLHVDDHEHRIVGIDQPAHAPESTAGGCTGGAWFRSMWLSCMEGAAVIIHSPGTMWVRRSTRIRKTVGPVGTARVTITSRAVPDWT